MATVIDQTDFELTEGPLAPPAVLVSPRWQTFVGIVASLTVVAALVAWTVEWPHWRAYFRWPHQDVGAWDKLVLFWLLWAKSLWILTPLAVVAGLLVWVRFWRTAWVVAWLGSSLLSCYLISDLRVHQVTGNHLIVYISMLGFDNFQPTDWMGQGELADAAFLTLLGGVALGTIVVMVACQWLVRKAVRRWQWQEAPWTGLTGSVACISLGIFLGGKLASNPLLVERLEREMPVKLGWFEAAGTLSGDFGTFREGFRREMGEHLARLGPKILEGQPADDVARLPDGHRPNVIVIVLESLRQDAINPEFMPQLARWASKGLRFQKHYAGSNCSHMGMFSLLYGKSPAVYHPTLDAAVPPQLVRTFRNSGYDCSFFSSGTVRWWRMDEFINAQNFDRVSLRLGPKKEEEDRILLRDGVLRQLRDAGGTPQFVVAFLMSTHWDYYYPKEYERHLPVIESFSFTDPNLKRHKDALFNRYRNSLLYMDDELSNLIERLDPTKNIVVVTGDHGESFWDDDTFAHRSRGSDVQMLVPLCIVGPGVAKGEIPGLTRHADLLPTLLHLAAGKALPVARTHGRDLIADPQATDRIALFPCRELRDYDLLLLHGRERLRVRLNLWDGTADADGYFDTNDEFEFSRLPSPKDLPKWRDLLLEELEKFAR